MARKKKRSFIEPEFVQKVPYDDTISVRCFAEDLDAFKECCQNQLGVDYKDITRELIIAFVEGRVNVELSEKQKLAQGFYK